MCGIWGFVGSDGTVPVRDAWDGLCYLTDRGPDDWGMYVDGIGKVTDESSLPEDDRSIVLGNRRLSILDLSSAGNQPINADDCWIVYNGEVYNYREIRSDLEDKGYEFSSDTDTEVILRAYQEYGQQCVDRFRGMFAFVVYDAAEETVFAARDRFGIKPFYYARTDGGLNFASELTSLLDADVVAKPTLDPAGVDGFLTFGYVPGPRTIVEDIRELPPGSTMSYDRENDDMEIRSYWSPSFRKKEEATAERVRELLEESIRLRLRSDVPVSAFLSGGLDSSSIVALMRTLGNADREDLFTFSIGFEETEFDEEDFATIIAERFDTNHYSRTLTPADVRENMDDFVASMDQPTVDGLNTYFVSELAAEHDAKVVLSGLGSDELFFGYPTFGQVGRWYPKANFLYSIPRAIRDPIASTFDWIGDQTRFRVGRVIADAIRSDAPFGTAYLTARGIFPSGRRESLTTQAENTNWAEIIERDLSDTVSTADVRDAVSEAELTWYMANQLLRDTDVMSMTHSLEVRVPFLDSELAEYVMAADADRKADGEKELLKDAMEDEVPQEVIERKKTGFTFPLGDWLRDELNDMVSESLSAYAATDIPISYDIAEDVHAEFQRGEIYWSQVWALVVLSQWIQTHFPEIE